MRNKFSAMSGIVALAALAPSAFGHGGEGEGASRAQAAELSLHRIERLVTLKKVDAAYANAFSKLELADAPVGNAEGAKFQSTAWQYPAMANQSASLRLLMDSSGKTLRYEVITGQAPAQALTWPDKDPVTLAENSLHYLESMTAKPEYDVFSDSLASLTVTQSTNASGAVVAVIDITAKETSKILRVVIKADGSFESAAILP